MTANWQLYQTSQKLDAVAMKMRNRGCLVDVAKKDEHRANIVSVMDVTKCRFKELIADETYQLMANGQNQSINKLFFEHFGLDPVAWSPTTGKPSLDEKALTQYIAMPGPHVQVAKTVLKYREQAKLLGTYIDGLPIHEDGRVHPMWKIWGTLSGRWSSSDPNFQNLPKSMRDMFVSEPGATIVGADYSALEARFVALFAGADRMLRWFLDGLDVHTENTKLLFGKAFIPKDQDKDKHSKQRAISKTWLYAKLYGSGIEQAWKALNAAGANLSLAMVRKMFELADHYHPEITVYQDQLLRTVREVGCVEEPFSGRRRTYHDGRIIPTEVKNFPMQSAAGWLMNEAVIKIDNALNWDSEYITANIHDAAYLHGANRDRLTGILTKSMEVTLEYKGRKMYFPVDVHSGSNLKEAA